MLVHQPVVEEAQEDEVVEVGPASVPPPDDVMCLGEPTRPASGEPALAVAVAEQPHHRGRGLPGHPAETQWLTFFVLDHGLHPAVAHQAPRGLGVDPAPVAHLRRPSRGREIAEPSVHDHRGSIGVGIVREPARADRDERIGAPRVHGARILFARHHRKRVGDPLQRAGDDRSLRRRELGLQSEPVPVVDVPPPQEPAPLRLANVVDRPTDLEIGPPPHSRAGHEHRPSDQPCLGFEGGEPGELDDLVDPELARREGSGQVGQVFEGVACGDPAPRLPLRDALADREPLRHVARSRATPDLKPIHLGDRAEHLALDPRRLSMCRVDGVDELVRGSILLWGHPRPLPVTGEETPTIPNIRSIVKSFPAL